MPVLTIRNVPPETYAVIESNARSNRRSLQQEVLLLLEREARCHRSSLGATTERWRKKLAGREIPDVVALLREENR